MLNLNQGWNLKGLYCNIDNVSDSALNNSSISTIWKWDNSHWSVWSPSTSVQQVLNAYSLNILSNINATDGFWVNALSNLTLQIVGTPNNSTTLNIVTNWQLLSLPQNKKAQVSQFNNDNISSIWKWDGSKWLVWSPSNSITQILQSYGITSFTSINSDEGFWVYGKGTCTVNVLFDETNPTYVCSIDNTTACSTENDCLLAAGYWYNNQCNATPEPDVHAISMVIGGITDNNLANGLHIESAHINDKIFSITMEINESAKNKIFQITPSFYIKDSGGTREYTATLTEASVSIDANGNISANIPDNATLSINGKDSSGNTVTASLANVDTDLISFVNKTLNFDISKIEAKLQSLSSSSLHKIFYDNSTYNVSFAINGLPGFSTIAGTVSFGIPPSAQCTPSQLNNCSTEADCQGANGYWYDNQCNSAPKSLKKWEYRIDGSVFSSPAIDSNGTIYVSSINKKVFSLNPNGTKNWEFTTGGYLNASPTIGADGSIYIGSHDHKFYAINSDGTKKWEYNVGSSVSSTAAIGTDGTIYFGSINGYLYALNEDGTLKWKLFIGGELESSPAIDSNGTIYIGSRNNKICAVNNNGTMKWIFNTGDKILSSPAIGNDRTIYIASNDNNLYALYDNGSLKWIFNAGDAIKSSPVIGSDTIYIASGNQLFALNFNGTEKWSYSTDNFIYSTPAIADDGTIYLGSTDNKLYAINSDGTLKWEFLTRDPIYSSPTIGNDGTIYIGSNDHRLYAINGVSSLSSSAIWPKFHKNLQNRGK
jgi:outer membrane protein assembly factor BamB